MIFTNFKVALILTVAMCLTLGLAPFNPEPHLVGKIRWLLGGGVGMDSARLLGSFAAWPALVGARYPAFEPAEELGLEA